MSAAGNHGSKQRKNRSAYPKCALVTPMDRGYTSAAFRTVATLLVAAFRVYWNASPVSEPSGLPRIIVVALLLIAVTLFPGCLRRRMTVRSNPPGAQVYIDNYAIGKTPVSTPFTYYGTREIRLVRDGYETLTTKERFLPPWYQWPVLDFVTENLWPQEIRDERVVDFQMVPQRIVPTDQLISRGENLRRGAQAGYVSPIPNAVPSSPPMPTQPPFTPNTPQYPPPSNFAPAPEAVSPPAGGPIYRPSPAPSHQPSPAPTRLPPPNGVPPSSPAW